MLRFSKLVILLLGLLLAGCTAPSSTATPIPTLPQPVITPSQVFTPAPSVTPSPTRILATPTSTTELTATPALFTETPEAIDFSPTATLSWWITHFRSPDGQWKWETTSPGPISNKTYLLFTRQDEKVKWAVDLAPKGIFPINYDVERWSTDGNFAYFRFTLSNEASGPGPKYCRYSWLKRINLLDGTVSSVIDFGVEESCWTYEFSPDMNWLAYIPPGEKRNLLVLLNMNTGQKLRYSFEPDNSGAGVLLWSPKSKELILTVLQKNTRSELSSSIYHAKIVGDTLQVEQVISRPGEVWGFKWEGDVIEVIHRTTEKEGNSLEIDIRTKKIIKITSFANP